MINNIWTIILVVGGLAYLFLVGTAIVGLIRLCKRTRSISNNGLLPSVSVIIAARNEEENIASTLSSVLAQDYEPFEVIVVDDRSDDRTAFVVEQIADRDERVRLIRQTSCQSGQSPKKQALERAIRSSHGEIIVTTDADCEHRPHWIAELTGELSSDAGMSVGQARFIVTGDDPLWQRLQSLDFQAQGVASAGLIASGMPFSCSGASMAYRRELFDQINGWDGVKHLISGDDELLLTKADRLGWKITVATDPDAVVRTLPVTTIKELWHQRIRWGSKGIHYRPSRVIVLIGIFLFYLMLMVGPIVWAFGGSGFVLIGAFGLKVVLDWIILHLGGKLFDDRFNPWEFLLLELLHPLLIVLLAVGGHFTKFEWKGQTFQQTRAREN